MPSRFFPFQLMTAGMDLHSPLQTSAPALMHNDNEISHWADNVTEKPIEQMLADSFNANNDVLAYVLSITGSKLPVLTPTPTWYTKFMTDYSNAQIHAMRWIDTIAPQLVSIPSSIIDFGLIFDLNYQNIQQVLPVLEKDPSNQTARQVVHNALTNLLMGLNAQLKAAVDFEAKLKEFTNNLAADAGMMQVAIDDAEKEIGYDQKKVENLLKNIEELKNEIKKWQTVITAAGIAGGVGIFTGCVIAVFTLGFGIAFGIAAAVASITTILVGQAKIRELNINIQKDQAEMDDLNRQISALRALQEQLKDLIKLSTAASAQMKLILQSWSELEREINVVIDDLKRADEDVYLGKVRQLEAELAAGREDWNHLMAYCKLIKNISYSQAQPASSELPHGTSPTAQAA